MPFSRLVNHPTLQPFVRSINHPSGNLSAAPRQRIGTLFILRFRQPLDGKLQVAAQLFR